MKSRLYLIRHGETNWNKERRFQGKTDIPLNEQGIIQAEALSQRLNGLHFDACYTSDLSRARDTATIIAKPHCLSLQECAALREMDFGLWEGLTSTQINENYAVELKSWRANPMSVRPPEGETLCEVTERSMDAVKEIISTYPDGQVLLISHGGIIRSIVAAVLGMDYNYYWRIRQDNTALSVIDFYRDDWAVLSLLNDCSHLAQGYIPEIL